MASPNLDLSNWTLRPDYPQERGPTQKVQGQRVHVCVSGVSAASPLISALAQRLAAAAEFTVADRPTPATPFGRWMTQATSLDGFGPNDDLANTTVKPDILLDLCGIETAGAQRTWRVVDASGRPLLKQFAAALSDRNLVSSLDLIEPGPTDFGWVALVEAHVSARRSDRDLSKSLARATVWLVTVALQGLRSDRALRPQPFRPLSARLADKWRARLSRMAARLRDHIGADVWAICTVDEPIENFLTLRNVAAKSWFEIAAGEGFVADPFPWPGREGVILHSERTRDDRSPGARRRPRSPLCTAAAKHSEPPLLPVHLR